MKDFELLNTNKIDPLTPSEIESLKMALGDETLMKLKDIANNTTIDDEDKFLLTEEEFNRNLDTFMYEFRKAPAQVYFSGALVDHMNPHMPKLLKSFVSLYRNVELWSDKPWYDLWKKIYHRNDKFVDSTYFYEAIDTVLVVLRIIDNDSIVKACNITKNDLVDFKNFVTWLLMESDLNLLFDVEEMYDKEIDRNDKDAVLDINLKVCRSIAIIRWVVNATCKFDDPVLQYSTTLKSIDGICALCMAVNDDDYKATHAYLINLLEKVIVNNYDIMTNDTMIHRLIDTMDEIFDLYSEVVPFASGRISDVIEMAHIEKNVDSTDLGDDEDDSNDESTDVSDYKDFTIYISDSGEYCMAINSKEFLLEYFIDSITTTFTTSKQGVKESELLDKYIKTYNAVIFKEFGISDVESLYSFIIPILDNEWYVMSDGEYLKCIPNSYNIDISLLREKLSGIYTVLTKEITRRKNNQVTYCKRDNTAHEIDIDVRDIYYAMIELFVDDKDLDNDYSLSSDDLIAEFIDRYKNLPYAESEDRLKSTITKYSDYINNVDVESLSEIFTIADIQAYINVFKVVFGMDEDEVDDEESIDIEEVQDNTGEDDINKKIQVELSDLIKFSNMVSDCCYTCIINKKSSLSVLTSIQKSFHDMLSKPGFSNYCVIVGLSYMQVHELMTTISENERVIFLNLNYFNTMVLGAKKFVSELLDTFVVGESDTDLVFKISLENIERVLDLYIDAFNLND